SYAVPNTLAWNNWYHVTAIYDAAASTVKVLLNGQQIYENTSAISTALSSFSDPFVLGRNPNTGAPRYFNGALDEVRVFTKALDLETVRQMMHQEIEVDGFAVKGSVIDRQIDNVLWNDLIAYYNFNRLQGDVLFNAATSSNHGKMFNIKSILPQSAPLPYVTGANGNLASTSTLARTDVWNAADLFDSPHAILRVSHDITVNNSLGLTGLFVDLSRTMTVLDGAAISNDYYVRLNGTIDLLGDAQLVQTTRSELDAASTGNLLRRQEGKSDVYSYNYWGSPVGIRNGTTNNNSFRLNMLKDQYGNIQFTGNSNPPATTPSTISTRWLYSFNNGVTYGDWRAVNPVSTNIAAGTGWSQKGAGTLQTSYIFDGKPNNGTINIVAVDTDGNPAVNDTESLLANPYPSAIDARTFIDDNIGIIDGVIYIWDQFRGTNHQLAYYEGGYATVTKMATVK
ncbi:MAG: LamG domain-containing protein, partial [Nonlabens sp.]|nr:LamG domain-containing protein [Nonlabens sp.]